MSARILATTVLTCISLAQAQLRFLPGDATIAPAFSDQTAPAVSCGGDTLFAVWTDNRANPDGPYTWSEYETSRDIYGVRLDTAGNVLDAVPLAIVAGRSNQNHPKVAWNGTNWLVVYQSVDLNGTGYYYQDSLEAVRVAPSGQVLDAEPIKLYGLIPSGPSYWALASDGNNWVVANQSTPTSSDIVAVRISSAGAVLDPPTHTLVPGTYYGRSNLKLAYAGSVFALTYSDDYVNGTYNTKLVRFDSNLTVLDAAPLTLLGVPLSDLASDGAGFYIVWHRQEPSGSVHVVGSRVNTAGVKLDGNGVNISGTREPVYPSITALAWDGVNWRVTWSDVVTFWIARVNTAGQVLDPGSVAVPGVQTGVTAGNGAGAIQLIWSTYTNTAYGDYDVFTANISPSNVAGPNRTLSVGAPQQLRPDVATSGDGYMLVYRSSANTISQVLAQPLDAAGNALTAEPVQLDAGPSLNGPGSPNVAWNGSLYLVSWSTPSGIVAQRLSSLGAKIDAAPFLVMSGCFGPADVAALGGDFLVTGRKVGINIQYIGPVGARVSGAGAILDASPLFLGISYVGRAPAVVALGDRWLVAWHRNVTHDDSYCFSMGAFISSGGMVTPEFQIHGPFSTAGGNGIFEVGLGSSGDKALFVQSQELTSGVETDLLCRVIDVGGTVGPQINLTPWSGNQYRPRVAWDGTNFVVAYQDQKNRLALWTLDQLDARGDLFAMRVGPTGTIVDPQGFAFSTLPTAETDPTVAAFNGTQFLAGAIMHNDANFANYRIAYELLPGNGPAAVINASATEGDVPLAVNFTSTGSTGISYLWDFGDGVTDNAANLSHTFTTPGEYLVTLTASDGAGRQSVQARTIHATAPNQIPIAVATADVYSGNVPFDVVFSAAQSYDPDGFIGNVEWLFSDGGSYWGATAYYTFYEPGPQVVTLNCYDARGGVGTTTLVINDVGSNLPPIVQASASPTSGSPPLTVQFSSAGSSDPDGTIVSYHWSFGDDSGVTSSEADPTHTYTHSGHFVATLTVTDNDNESRSQSVGIDVLVMHHVEYGVNLSLGPTHYIEHYEQGEQGVGEIFEEDIIADYGRVAGTANVGFGVNKARVDLAGTNPDNPFFYEYGFASSRYWDMFQFDDPELNGTAGFFDVTLYVAGSGYVNLSESYLQSPSTEFDAFWHAVINVSVDGVTDEWDNPIQSVFYAGEWYKGLDSTTLDYYGDPLNTDQQSATIEFIYGQPIFMDSFLQVDTRFDNQIASVPGTLDTVIDLANSSYWGGITNLRDAQGNPVLNATYASSSGFDYRQPAAPVSLSPASGDDTCQTGGADTGIPCTTNGDCAPPAVCGNKSRYVSVTPTNADNTSIQVQVVSSPQFPSTVGDIYYAGVEQSLPNSPNPALRGAPLQCTATPNAQVWTGGVLHLYGAAIVPGSTYNVRMCDVGGSNCSDPLLVATAKWGDVVRPFGGQSQPNFADVSSIVDKFRNLSSAPDIPRVDLIGNGNQGQPDTPNQAANFADISADVDAFRGFAYGYAVPPCP